MSRRRGQNVTQSIRNLADRPDRFEDELRVAEQAVVRFASVYAENWRSGAQSRPVIDAEREIVHAQLDALERALDRTEVTSRPNALPSDAPLEAGKWKR